MAMENSSAQAVIVDDPKSLFFSTPSNSIACIMLVEKACEQYQTIYSKLDVPFSYIKFFFEEFVKYSSFFENKLKEFYSGYTANGATIDDVIAVYSKSFYSTNSGSRAVAGENYLVFDFKISSQLTSQMQQVTNLNMNEMANNIINICKKIDNSDEIVSKQDLYETFMINQFILTYPFGKAKETKKKIKSKISKIEVDKAAADKSKNKPAEDTKAGSVTLIGASIEDKYQEGKITKVVIPRLKLPSAYPFSPDSSRVDKDRRASSFCTPARQVVFINKNKIVSIKYSSAFLEKRKVKKSKKKFDWDF